MVLNSPKSDHKFWINNCKMHISRLTTTNMKYKRKKANNTKGLSHNSKIINIQSQKGRKNFGGKEKTGS